jgi:hypothetical protein
MDPGAPAPADAVWHEDRGHSRVAGKNLQIAEG